jgi:phospholipid/cholesterol/gamma-HCH transport system permease protein
VERPKANISWTWGKGVWFLEGSLDWKGVPLVDAEFRHTADTRGGIDLSRLTGIDPAGVAWLEGLSAGEHEKNCMFETLPESLKQFRASFTSSQTPEVPPEKPKPFLLQQGAQISRVMSDLRSFIVLASDTLHWTAAGIFRPGDRRRGSVISHCFTMGVEAFGIIALLSFILGFILALQSAIQLRQFGAGLLVANLLTLALIHEMGPIMTSIIIAGRTGSSVAAEIATMGVTEELDALRMMALDPVRFVLVPKMMAITIVMPLLLTISIVMGILGGTVVGVTYLDITPLTYLRQSLDVIVLKDIIRSYSKIVVFAWVIVLIGAHFGFNVKGGAEGVGRATTQSVVAAIFAILVLDALFSFTLLLE